MEDTKKKVYFYTDGKEVKRKRNKTKYVKEMNNKKTE